MYARQLSPIQRAMIQRGSNVPRGAQYGAVAGQAQAQPQRPQMRQQMPGGRVPAGLQRMLAAQAQQNAQQAQIAIPQGADAGALAGCGDGSCMEIPYGAPFAGYPIEPQPWMQPAALIPIQVGFADPADSVTLQVSCGNSLFYGCGARSFNGPGEVNILSAFTGATDVDLFCAGSGGLDISYFNTNGNQCLCEFDWGCFSSFFPLIIEFGAIGVPSVAPLVNMVIGGSRLQGGNACSFWPGMYGGPGVGPVGVAALSAGIG